MAYIINGKTFSTKINEVLEKEEDRRPLESFLRRTFDVENLLYIDARRKK